MATWSCFGPVMLCLRAQLLVFLSLNPAGTTQGHCSWTSDPQTWLWMAGRHQQCGKVGVAATWSAVSKNSFDKETIALVLYLNLSQLMRVLSKQTTIVSVVSVDNPDCTLKVCDPNTIVGNNFQQVDDSRYVRQPLRPSPGRLFCNCPGLFPAGDGWRKSGNSPARSRRI